MMMKTWVDAFFWTLAYAVVIAYADFFGNLRSSKERASIQFVDGSVLGDELGILVEDLGVHAGTHHVYVLDGNVRMLLYKLRLQSVEVHRWQRRARTTFDHLSAFQDLPYTMTQTNWHALRHIQCDRTKIKTKPKYQQRTHEHNIMFNSWLCIFDELPAYLLRLPWSPEECSQLTNFGLSMPLTLS